MERKGQMGLIENNYQDGKFKHDCINNNMIYKWLKHPNQKKNIGIVDLKNKTIPNYILSQRILF